MKQTNRTSNKVNKKQKVFKVGEIGFFKRASQKYFGNKKNKNRSKSTERIMAQATQWIAIGTLGLVAVSYFTLKENAKEFSASHRPWVNISGDIQTRGPLVFDKLGFHITVSYTLKNGGSAPAIGVYPFSGGLNGLEISNTPPEPPDCNDIKFSNSADFANAEKPSDTTGDLLLPGETRQETMKLESIGMYRGNIQGGIWFPLCICYKDDLGKFHQTSIIWQFIPSNMEPTTGKSVFILGKSIEGKFMRFDYHDKNS